MAPGNRESCGEGYTETPEGPGREPGAIALARGHLYRFFSVALGYPDGDFAALWRREAYGEDLANCARLLSQPRNAGGTVREPRPLVEALEAMFANLDVAPLGDLQAEYRDIFGHTMGLECAAYETLYGSEDIFQEVQALADIAGWYRAFGLMVAPEAKERVDHIGVELEFMYVLAYKEAYALERDAMDRAQLCVEAEAKFLQEHLGRWGPLFARLLGKGAHDGFYRGLAQGLDAFLGMELARFEIDPLPLMQPQPAPLPRGAEPACDECPLLAEESREGMEGSL
ncbi:MAG: molecular chaperone TorD family protein [Nitrospinae bacterium]|nr:molecular chaperone TorD family protein [Nitrospinota bacterium]